MVLQPAGTAARVRAAVRRLMSGLFRDLAVAGAAFCGSADVLVAIRQTPAGATDGSRSPDDQAREVLEGIAEIEDYLAAQADRPKPSRGRGRPPGEPSPPS